MPALTVLIVARGGRDRGAGAARGGRGGGATLGRPRRQVALEAGRRGLEPVHHLGGGALGVRLAVRAQAVEQVVVEYQEACNDGVCVCGTGRAVGPFRCGAAWWCVVRAALASRPPAPERGRRRARSRSRRTPPQTAAASWAAAPRLTHNERRKGDERVARPAALLAGALARPQAAGSGPHPRAAETRQRAARAMAVTAHGARAGSAEE